MKFYKIKSEHANHILITPFSNIRFTKNEIFTINEMKMFGIPMEYTQEVECSKSEAMYWTSNGRRHRYTPESFPKFLEA